MSKRLDIILVACVDPGFDGNPPRFPDHPLPPPRFSLSHTTGRIEKPFSKRTSLITSCSAPPDLARKITFHRYLFRVHSSNSLLRSRGKYHITSISSQSQTTQTRESCPHLQPKHPHPHHFNLPTTETQTNNSLTLRFSLELAPQHSTHSHLRYRADHLSHLVPCQLLPHGLTGSAFRGALWWREGGGLDEQLSDEQASRTEAIKRMLVVRRLRAGKVECSRKRLLCILLPRLLRHTHVVEGVGARSNSPFHSSTFPN